MVKANVGNELLGPKLPEKVLCSDSAKATGHGARLGLINCSGGLRRGSTGDKKHGCHGG